MSISYTSVSYCVTHRVHSEVRHDKFSPPATYIAPSSTMKASQ